MKTIIRKNTRMAILAIAASANMSVALADIHSGASVFLTPRDHSTDVYGLTCPIGTVTVRTQVGNKIGGGSQFISVQVINPNGDAVSTNSPEGIPSPTLVLSGGGAGNYLVTVHKTPSGVVEPYDINMDCFDANRIAFSGIQSTLVQNQ
jgi:hypothetical protein